MVKNEALQKNLKDVQEYQVESLGMEEKQCLDPLAMMPCKGCFSLILTVATYSFLYCFEIVYQLCLL